MNEREYADWKMWGISLRKIVLKCVTRQTVSRHSRKYQPYFDRALESISLYYQATRYIAVDWKDKEILWQISTFKFAAFFTLPRLIDQRETSVSGLPHHAWSHFSAWGHYIPFKHNMLSLSLSYKEELNRKETQQSLCPILMEGSWIIFGSLKLIWS